MLCTIPLGCQHKASEPSVRPIKKTVVIGFDGMDPRLATRMMDAGELPNLNRMRQGGGFRVLQTSIPPQSPVAWSNFITGAGPGVHGIFDFIHREPAKQCEPFYAAAETVKSEEGWRVGDYRLPLTIWPFKHNPTQTFLRRMGTPFWAYLDAAGINTRIYDIPADYPPEASQHGHHCCLSGMGVPDMLGTYGTYQHFDQSLAAARQESGGIRSRLDFVNDAARATLVGPANESLVKGKPATVNFDIYRDVQAGAVLIELQKQRCLIGKGQWSDWMRVEFAQSMPSFLPDSHLHGICRFYLQEVAPSLRLYVTPINMDPTQPAVHISEPPEFVQQIAGELGLFYTTGFQEDYNARSNKVFTDDEYAEQANIVLDERRRLFRYALDHFAEGVLFFYFSSTDLQAHIFWWDGDAKHPFRSPDEAKKGQNIIKDLYRKMDEVVGDAQARLGSDITLLVMSDHGFANFRRQFNLNTWLREHGYLYPVTCTDLLQNADWSRTRAYGLGLNGLYLNLRGRERDGVVSSAPQREALLAELIAQLEAVRDADGQPVVKKVYRADQVYTGPNLKYAPDLIIGYHREYRASWATTLGQITPETISDNNSPWSADHCMAADEVPGVLFSNRAIASTNPSLIDLAPTILSEYSVSIPPEMTGHTVFTAGSGRKTP